MAKPTKLRNKYYVRMAVLDTDGSTKYKWISLGTDNLAVAQERMLEVLGFSELIRSGKSIDFWWKTDFCQQTVPFDEIFSLWLFAV